MVAISAQTTFPPRTILDENGALSGVILSVADYKSFLQLLAKHADWERLPEYLQDAVDNMLADEALSEEGPLISLEELMAET